MIPPPTISATSVGLLIVAIGALGYAAAILALRLPGGTWPERGTAALLALWGLLLIDCWTIGCLPGGMRPWPLTLGALGLTAGVRLLVRRYPLDPPRVPLVDAWRAIPRPARLLLIGLGLALVVLTSQMLRLPPTGVDSLGYHLLGPMAWALDGRIHQTSTYWDWANSYPQNVEYLAGFVLAYVPHTRLADLCNPLWLLLAFAALVSVGRRLDADWEALGAVGFGLILSPFVACFATATYTDIPVAAALLGAVACVLTARATDARIWLGIAWLALCLAAGSKPSALIGAVVIVASAWALVPNLMKALRLRSLVPAIGCFALFTGIWYFRSWLWYGNPAHPWTLALGPLTLFEGAAGNYSAHLESIAPLHVGKAPPLVLGILRYFGHFGGDLRTQLIWAREWFGPQASIVGTVAMLWCLQESIARKLAVQAWVLGIGLLLAATNLAPMVPRFAAHLPLWLALASALLFTRAPLPLQRTAYTVFISCLCFSLLVLPFSLLPIDESTNLPDRFYTYQGSELWFTATLIRPGDTVVYVQPLRNTGRLARPDLTTHLRYCKPLDFDRRILAPTGTTWLVLADEERISAVMNGPTRDLVEATLRSRAPELRFELLASGTTFTLRNYRLYALRPPLAGGAP